MYTKPGLVTVTPPPLPASAGAESTEQKALKTVRIQVGCVADALRGTKADLGSTLDPSDTEDAGPSNGSWLKSAQPIPGFTLLEKLGEGAFAKVYLATQNAIAGRQVVLKITEQESQEADRLGRLEHPNVVPIYSVHQASTYWVICMPFLGRSTLADVIGRKASGVTTCLDEVNLPTFVVTPADGKKPPARDPAPATLPLFNDVPRIFRLIADLAAGLDHAHRRGILHLDIKPTNVLLADSGRPMLLDFNLSHDTATERRTRVGGTIPYMAPEQIAELITRESGTVDERSDLFGLGALAYELLTGEYAFPLLYKTRAELPKYLADRRARRLSVRAKNPRVSPAEDAIVLKLLAPDPADRYQTALELMTDVDRHLADRLLAFTPNRSIRERVAKWRRRNHRYTLRLAAVSAVGLAVGSAVLNARTAGTTRPVSAAAQGQTVRANLATLRIDLTAPDDSPSRARGRLAAGQHLAAFGLPDDPAWMNRDPYATLPEAVKADVAADLAELLRLVAHARIQDGRRGSAPEWQAATTEADRLTRLARDGAPDAPSLDRYLVAVRLVADGRYRDAVPVLERVVAEEPGHGAGHFVLAYCRHQLGQFTRALESYNIAHALLPSDPRPVFNRGVIYGLLKKHPLAEAEFTAAVAIDPTNGEAYRNRAVARLRQEKWREAEQDLSAALDRNVSAAQVFALRAFARGRLGDHRGAEADRLAANRYPPRTADDFLARGVLHLPAAPDAARADFEAAARLAPGSLAALQNLAHVSAAGDPSRSLEWVTRAVDRYPEYAPARAARAVLFARRGNETEARRDAEAARSLADESDAGSFLEPTDLYGPPRW